MRLDLRLELDDAEVQALGAGGFIMRDGLLGEEAALAVAAEAADLPGFRPAGMARSARRDRAIRGDELVWLDPSRAPPALAHLCRALGDIGAAIDAAAYLGLGRFDVQVARYPASGARYQRHRDAFTGGESRRLTLIYYANPGWRTEHGGVLRVYPGDGDGNGNRHRNGNGHTDTATDTDTASATATASASASAPPPPPPAIDIEPCLDRLIAFLSHRLEHEVLPVHSPRLAITAWFYGRHPLHGRAARA
jgi:SM-20-related protein